MRQRGKTGMFTWEAEIGSNTSTLSYDGLEVLRGCCDRALDITNMDWSDERVIAHTRSVEHVAYLWDVKPKDLLNLAVLEEISPSATREGS